MFLIPLNQIESVDLVIHALRAAGGEADCSMCPVRKVCTKQCLALADGIQRMVADHPLPSTGPGGEEPDQDPPDQPGSGGPGGHLRIVK